MPCKQPNPATYNPDPDYLKGLIDASGLKQKEAAELIDLSPRMLRYYLGEAGTSKHHDCPYLVQFALECLADPGDTPGDC